jgi:hypothetical protein
MTAKVLMVAEEKERRIMAEYDCVTVFYIIINFIVRKNIQGNMTKL